jgi:glycogen debranching enzyme
MLMSKNWMTAVWSWDHCFNAMALSLKDPQLAWDQLMVPFDNQQPQGALPDQTKTSSIQINFSKPPIHGWTLLWMMHNSSNIDAAHLEQIYTPLVRWTDWYFTYRNSSHDGLPEYDHGFDLGWDNSTVFQSGIPVETPDLASFLVIQMNALAEIAGKLGKQDDKAKWESRSDELMKRMLSKLWKQDHFVAIRADNGSEIDSQSLLLYLPIVLGKQLPTDVREKLVSGLMKEGRYRTANGFATEALTSKDYSDDSYWRGPIWAPATMILAEGLDSAGEHALAHQLREDFCRMAQEHGMSENFNAVTGEGLRDPAYTWTSSVYLIFAHQLMADGD